MESEHFSHISRCLTTLNQTNLCFGFSFCQEDYILHLIKPILSTISLFRAKLWSNKSDVYACGFYRRTELQCASVDSDHENHSIKCLQRRCECIVSLHHQLTEEIVGVLESTSSIKIIQTIFIKIWLPTCLAVYHVHHDSKFIVYLPLFDIS